MYDDSALNLPVGTTKYACTTNNLVTSNGETRAAELSVLSNDMCRRFPRSLVREPTELESRIWVSKVIET